MEIILSLSKKGEIIQVAIAYPWYFQQTICLLKNADAALINDHLEIWISNVICLVEQIILGTLLNTLLKLYFGHWGWLLNNISLLTYHTTYMGVCLAILVKLRENLILKTFINLIYLLYANYW